MDIGMQFWQEWFQADDLRPSKIVGRLHQPTASHTMDVYVTQVHHAPGNGSHAPMVCAPWTERNSQFTS